MRPVAYRPTSTAASVATTVPQPTQEDEMAKLRRERAAFKEVVREESRRNGWMASPALRWPYRYWQRVRDYSLLAWLPPLLGTLLTALEDVQTILAESLIGAFHSAAGRIERDADRARDRMRALERDFDGSEMADTELQEATQAARAAEVAQSACELIRDAAAETFAARTGEVWTRWHGSGRGTHLSAAQLEAKQALRAIERRKSAEADPGGPVVAFRGAPFADSQAGANRIFDALNWARSQWPDMALATTGARGAERLAIRWAQQKGVTLVLARVDFDRHRKAAPFRANDELLALEPTCCLTLAQSLDGARAAESHPFGPAQNLAQQAAARGVQHVAIRPRTA